MSGDGGFTMMMGDFISLTPARPAGEGRSCCNNGTLGFVEMEMKASGFLDTGVRAQEPELRRDGRGDGHQGHPGRGPAASSRARCARRLAHNGPALVDVVSARQELVMPPKTTFEQAEHFGLFMLKAVMDGRATELIDLARTNLRI